MTPIKKRIAIVVAATALFSSIGGALGSAQAAPMSATDPSSTWLCGSVWPVAGVCLDSPLRWTDELVDSAGLPPQ